MRQYQIKLLGIMAMDVKSEAAKEAYQVYVDANDQLEGIVVCNILRMPEVREKSSG